MTLQWLTGWWNVIFLAPFALALLYVGLYSVSGLGFGDAESDAHADADAGGEFHGETGTDLDAEAEADAHVDSELDHDAAVDTDHAGDHLEHGPGHGGVFFTLLSLLGVGRAPLSVLLMVLMLTWGLIGFVSNTLLAQTLPRAADEAWKSILIAAAGSLLCTRLIAGAMHRYLPSFESYAGRRHDLLGMLGQAVLPIGHERGRAAVRDARGNLFQVSCLAMEGGEPIAKGAHVKLVGYNAKRTCFYAVPVADGTRGHSGKSTGAKPC